MKRAALLCACLFYVHSACGNLVSSDDPLLKTLKNALDGGLVSDTCQEVLEVYLENLRNITELWAVQMLDASSKIPVGLLSLNLAELGQFSQCLAAKSSDGHIKGKYCLGMWPLSTISNEALEIEVAVLHKQAHHTRQSVKRIVNLQETNNDNSTIGLSGGVSWAICLPSKCSDEDVGAILGLLGLFSVECQTEEDLNPPLTTGAIATIVILSLFAFFLITSTMLDLYYKSIQRVPPHALLIAFSMYTNGKKLFRISKNSNELSCLNGIRFWSMMWVIVGHLYLIYTSIPVSNYRDVIEWMDTLRSMFIVSGTLSVDSFFFLAGLLVVYSYMKAKHNGTKFNIFYFYIHRYLRLTPVLAVTILVTAHLLKYMGSGPKWSFINIIEEGCQRYWWTALLYIQNYSMDYTDNICIPQTWYLSADMHMYIISPLFLIPLWKYPKIGVGLVASAIAVFIIVPFSVAFITEIPAIITDSRSADGLINFIKMYYMKTHTRAAPYFIGLLIGYSLARIKFRGEYRHLTYNKLLIVLLWAICMAIGLTCIFGGHESLRFGDYNKWANSFYLALHRPAWAVCLAWVVFACVTGYGGPINWLLSLPIYQVLNRFTYSMYLLHFQLLVIFGFSMKKGIYFDEISFAYSFWGITMITFGLSIIWVMAFESPIVILENLIFGGSKKHEKEQERNENKNTLPA